MDKMYYNGTDTAHVVITGPPSTPVNLVIIDSSSQQKLANVVQLNSNGTGIFSFNLASFSDGIYYAMIGQGYGSVKIGFGVGIMPTGPQITIHTSKYSFVPGELIQVVGSWLHDSITKVDLKDPYGTIENSTNVTSDHSGNFMTTFQVPQYAINGTWNIDATSGEYHTTISIAVNSSNSIPPNAIRTSNGGWVTPLQTTGPNGTKLTIHYETGIPVTGNVLPPGPPPSIDMTLQTDSQAYTKDDTITISGKEDNYLLQNYGNGLTISVDDTRTGVRWCCDNFKSNADGSFYYSFKMPGIFSSSDNYNARITPTSSNSTVEYGTGFLYYTVLPFPLEQFRTGISAVDVICKDNFVHIIKAEDGSPACVSPNTAQKLIERGWTKEIVSQISENHDPFGITALVIYHPFLGCLSSGCPPNNFYLKINSNATAYLTGYNICDGDSCAKNNDLSLLLPINTVLNPNYQSIGLPVNLQWKDGDTVNIQLEVSPNADNKTASLIDLENSTIVP